MQKVLKVVSDVSVTNVTDATATRRAAVKGEHKLLRCDNCGTWIPADRALTLSSGLSTYCSRECLEKNAESKERRAAG
jgi:ribosomal protein S26